MSAIDDLSRRLELADRGGWEDAYACTPVELSRSQMYELVTSDRPWSDWVAFRFDAGPPGVPLPAHEQAVAAVLNGKDGTPLDAYRVVFAPHPIHDEAPPMLILAVLINSAACALKGGTTWFATWLAARAGLAALAFGQPERAWHLLDSLTIGGRRHPHLDKLAMFEPLRGNAALERDPHVRAAIGWLWPRLNLPVVPRLPLPPTPAQDSVALEDTLDELKRIGADHLRELLMTHMDAVDRALLEEHADHPLVRELRARELTPGADAPDCGDLPPWFEAWTRAVFRTGQWYLARLAGIVLHRAGYTDDGFIGVLIMLTARAADLPLLAACFDQPEMQSTIDELAVAACALPVEAADALVAEAWPHHVDAGRALPVLAQHVDALERLDARAGGIVEHITRMMRSMVVDRTRDLAEAGPAVERLHTAVRRAAARLNDAGPLGAPDVERAAANIAVPDLTLGLLERTDETSGELAQLEQLLLALAVRRALAGTEREAHWRPAFSKIAADAVFELGAPTLFGLRLQLLDELLAVPHRLMSLGELYFQRANTRQVLSRSNGAEIALALDDLRAAVRWSRMEGDASRCAAATAAWVRIVAWQDVSGEAGPSAIDEGRRLLDEALALALEPRDQALLHQARAHLIRRRHPQDALLAHEQALAVVPPEEPHATELAAELVTALVRTRRVSEAVDRGLAFLETASCRTKATNLGMLHLSLGEALVAAGRFPEARRQLEAGLPLIRGREIHNEEFAHLQLARLGLITGDPALAEEHLRLLRDRTDTLDDSARRDFHALEATAVHALEATAIHGAGRIEGTVLGGGREDDTPVAPESHGSDVLRFLADPAGEAFMRIRTQRMPSAASDVDAPGFVARFELAVPAATDAPAARDPVRLDKLEALEDTIRSQATDKTRPGALAAAVALVAHLARAGRRSIEDVRTATTAACAALPAVVDPGVRSILLREIALVWSRDRRLDDPVRDLALAIDLLRQCIELEGGEDRAAGDTVVLLARALRESAGDRRDNLREALGICELELATATDDTVVDRLERAWAIVAEATPYLVLHVESREREARTAMRIAAGLSHRFATHATRATQTTVAGVAYVLDGEDAEVVARWLLRAQEPARRPLRARLARPLAVSARRWEEWISALATRDEDRMAEALDRVRAAEPHFPDDPKADEPTWRWLLAHRDSAAISLVLTEPAALAVILQIDPSGLRRTWVLGLDLPPPPLAWGTLAGLVSNQVPGQEAGRAIESLAGWLRQQLVAPLERFLGRAPTAVLWCPDPRLRLIAPRAIWPGLPVAMTASLALPNLAASPSRLRSTLIVLADPGAQAREPGLDLRGHGLPALESLALVAKERGAVRLLGSVGRASGHALLGDRTAVRNTPASAADLLKEAGEHDMIVVIAHGRVDAIEDAALLCLDKDGDLDRLDVTALAREPDRFAGATVLLLSCETGRASDSLAEPGGVAGTLISAGARHVIAPLWPVQLDVAVQVGEAVLRGIQRDAAPWEVLAALGVDGADDAPTLGGPPPPPAMQRAERRLQGLAFVTWVG